MDKVVEVVRGVVRPLIALAMIGGLIGQVFTHMDVTEEYWLAVGVVTTFYFVSREKSKP